MIVWSTEYNRLRSFIYLYYIIFFHVPRYFWVILSAISYYFLLSLWLIILACAYELDVYSFLFPIEFILKAI